MGDGLAVTIGYVNHRDEYSLRRIVPIQLYFGSTEWHPKAQWLLKAFDVDKQAERDFAMYDIISWT